MNPRIQYYERGNAFVCGIDKTEFAFDKTDKESRRAALSKLDAHGSKLISQLETQAGRPLNPLELLHGVSHVDTRTRDERVAEITAKRLQEKRPGSVRVNPYQVAIDAGEVDPPKKETRREMYERRALEWDEQQKVADEQRNKAMDQARQRSVEEAEKELLQMRFDPKATLQDINKAEMRLELAREGDLGEYRRQAHEWQAIKQARIDGQSAAIDQQIRDLQKRKVEMRSGVADTVFTPKPAVSELGPNGQWTNAITAQPVAAQSDNQ
jgi:hypothetical protein